jgi:fatty-acyl-CoA synthase
MLQRILELPASARERHDVSALRVIASSGVVAPGRTGRIFVGSELLFDGYTGGDDKTRLGALMATGDVGHFDEAGRLFVPHAGVTLTAEQVKDHVRANLARYKVPRDVLIVAELPRNATGKVLGRALARD